MCWLFILLGDISQQVSLIRLLWKYSIVSAGRISQLAGVSGYVDNRDMYQLLCFSYFNNLSKGAWYEEFVYYYLVLLAISTIPVAASSDEDNAPIKNPTLADLQEKWDGTLSRPFRGLVWSAISKRYGKSVVVTFDGAKAAYTSADASLNMDVKIAAEVITLSGGKRTDTCNLSKSSDTRILDCEFEVAASEANRSYSGKMHLKKKN